MHPVYTPQKNEIAYAYVAMSKQKRPSRCVVLAGTVDTVLGEAPSGTTICPLPTHNSHSCQHSVLGTLASQQLLLPLISRHTRGWNEMRGSPHEGGGRLSTPRPHGSSSPHKGATGPAVNHHNQPPTQHYDSAARQTHQPQPAWGPCPPSPGSWLEPQRA